MTSKEFPLDSLITERTVYEFILTTVGRESGPNAAPVGAKREKQRVYAELSSNTQSAANLSMGRLARFNIVTDPFILCSAAFDALPEDEFLEAYQQPPKLRHSLGDILTRVDSSEHFNRDDDLGKTPFLRFRFKILRTEISSPAQPPSRGLCAALEAMIKITRAKVALRRGKADLSAELCREAREALSVAARISKHESMQKTVRMCESELNDIMRGVR